MLTDKLIYVKAMEHVYPDCDLITLADGRVLGISKEYVMLYDNMDDFYNCDPSDKPTIDLGVFP